MAESTEDQAVTNFRTYLRINTAQPTPNYDAATAFYKLMAEEIGLDFTTVQIQPSSGNHMDILTWRGTEPSWPSVMLYSHTDVVPVFPEHWKYDPFTAHKDENGDIFARGVQDMKCVGMQYLEAVRRLKSEGIRLQRTVHIIFGPDEEIGGKNGMEKFVKQEEFKLLNIGFALDEGLANPESEFRLFYGERSCWWFTVTFRGKPGHGSAFIEDTAVAKLNRLMNTMLQFRTEQENRLKADSSLTLGDVTSVNITILKGGVQYNVVPVEMSAAFDVRIPPTVNLAEFESMIRSWCKEAGTDFEIKFEQKGMSQITIPTDDSNHWWTAFSAACQTLGIKLKKEIFPAGTDGRYLKEVGIPVLGFSPMNNTPVLLHDHNEYLNEGVFLQGIKIYEKIIQNLGNVSMF